LLALEDDVQPAEFVLSGELCTLGRSAQCDLVVARPAVSRLHAQVERSGPRYLLRDMGSANGTFVNSQRLHGIHLLTHRDLIGLGAPTALLRFADPDPTIVPTSRIRFDEPTRRFYLGETELDLTPTQYRLLMHLYQYLDRVVSRESCAVAIWGEDYAPGLDADTLDKAISTLRGKLRRADPSVEVLVTRPGLGYTLVSAG
jgi:DNA-binding response OmpR family regulator